MHRRQTPALGFMIVFLIGMIVMVQAVSAAGSDNLGLANGKNVLFVDKGNTNCDDSYSRTQALSGQTPWCSLTPAVSKMQDGDTVYVLGGTYRSTGPLTISGKTFSKKTTITAYPGEHPVITTAIASLETAPNNKWTFAGDSTHNLWYTSYTKTTTGEFVGRYMDTGVSLFTYSTSFSLHNSLSDLRDTANPEGLFYDSGSKRIYVRFDDLKKDPNNIRLSISENIGFDIENVDGAGLEISGFTIQDSYRNIYVKNSDNVIIKDNTAIGGIYSIDVRSSGNVVINGNEVQMSPGSDWTWNDDTKRSAMETSGICLIDDLDNLVVSGNLLHGYFNGIYVFTQKTGKFKDIQVFNNTLHDIYDDAIEIEDYCNGGRFFRNKVTDAFVAISLSPVDATQKTCRVYNNVLVADKVNKWDHSGTTYLGECYKIIDTDGIEDVIFESNTCVGRGVYTTTGKSHTQKDTDWINNIFYSDSEKALEKSGMASDGVMYDYNIYFRKSSGPLFRYWNSDTDTTQFNTLAAALSSKNDPGNWDMHSKDIDPLFNNLAGGDYRPKASSQACSMSTTGSYVGALPCIGQAASFCGDGYCSNDEDCQSCSFDCGECTSYCGDGTCDADESCSTCSQDCGSCAPAEPYCGDGICNPNESCSSCSQDCGTCQPYCGDGDCSADEDCSSCSQDCGTCQLYCGDGKCDPTEDCSSCSQDCGACPAYCGDGTCDPNENCGICSQDCGTCPVDEYHWLESEVPISIQAPMIIEENDTASNSQYIFVPLDHQGNDGDAEYSVNIKEPGDYVIWGRVIAPEGDQNSFFVDADGSGDNLWELGLTSTWEWQEVNNRDVADPAIFTLSKGAHTITIKQREANSRIDKIFLTNDFNYTPKGEGEEAENLNVCGDGKCDINEDCSSCSKDCGSCPAYCGDGKCNPNENCNSCSKDCGACAPAQPYCGDGTCSSDESCSSCSKDCGVCQSYCGDGTCDTGEDCSSCSKDCGTCSAGEMHWLESEYPDDLTWPMKISKDTKASNGKFIYVPNDLGYNGRVTFKVNIKKSGNYVLWGRVIGPGPYDDSFFVQMDGKSLNLWDMGGDTSWNWQAVSNRGGQDPVVFKLSKGTHTITIRQREDGAKIDKMLLTSDIHYTPTGKGDTAENIKFCGDGVCDSDENCNSCSKDCGVCETKPSGDSGGSGGGGGGGSTSSGGGGGSSGGPPLSGSVKSMEFTNDEIMFTGGYRDTLKFSVEDEEHTLKIDELNSMVVKFTLNSTAIEDKISVDETRSYDVQGDKLDDINITLESISNGKATIRITILDRQALLNKLAQPNDTAEDAMNDTPDENYTIIGTNEKLQEPLPLAGPPNQSSMAGITGAVTSTKDTNTIRIFSMSVILFFASGMFVFLFFRFDAGADIRRYFGLLQDRLVGLSSSRVKVGGYLTWLLNDSELASYVSNTGNYVSNAGNNIAGLISETWSTMNKPAPAEKRGHRSTTRQHDRNLMQQAESRKSDNLSELRQWVNLALQHGFDEQYITRILTARGWRLDIINRMLGN